MSCIFCQIAMKKAHANILYEDDEIVAFRDMYPQAPVHYLVMPRKHIGALSDMTGDDFALIGKMARVATELARREGISEKGFRIAVNCGREGGQTVGHVHMHALGGRRLNGHLG